MTAAAAGIFGVVALTEAAVPDAGVAAAAAYVLLLMGCVPHLVWLGTTLTMVSISVIAKLWAPDVTSAVCVLLAACTLYRYGPRLSESVRAPHRTDATAMGRLERVLFLLPLVLSSAQSESPPS